MEDEQAWPNASTKQMKTKKFPMWISPHCTQQSTSTVPTPLGIHGS